MFHLLFINEEIWIVAALILVSIMPILLFLFWRSILKKRKGAISNPIYSIVISVITTPIVSCLLIYSFNWIDNYFLEKSFDRYAWLTNKEARSDNMSSLKKQRLIENMTKGEVKVFLGEPDSETSSSFTYYIGETFSITSFRSKPDYMTLRFENDVVSEISE